MLFLVVVHPPFIGVFCSFGAETGVAKTRIIFSSSSTFQLAPADLFLDAVLSVAAERVDSVALARPASENVHQQVFVLRSATLRFGGVEIALVSENVGDDFVHFKLKRRMIKVI